MRAASAATGNCANSAGEKPRTRNEKGFVAFGKILNAIRLAWPRKTAASVAHLTGVEERTVQFWLAGETRMSVDAMGALLRTEEGYAILEAIMGDSKARWWLATKTSQEIRKSRIALKAEEARHEKLRAQLSLLDQ